MRYYTMTDAAKRLGITRQRVDQLMRSGVIAESNPIPGLRRITGRELARFARMKRPNGIHRKDSRN